MDSYDLVLQGLEYAKKGNVMKENTQKAVELFEKAIELELSYARAHAWRACTLSNLADWEESPDPKIFENAFKSIQLALELDSNEPEVHRIMGALKLWHERDHEMARYHFEKARELCPSDVFIISRYAIMLIYFAEFDKALEELERAKSLTLFPTIYFLVLKQFAITGWITFRGAPNFQESKSKKEFSFYIALANKNPVIMTKHLKI